MISYWTPVASRVKSKTMWTATRRTEDGELTYGQPSPDYTAVMILCQQLNRKLQEGVNHV